MINMIMGVMSLECMSQKMGVIYPRPGHYCLFTKTMSYEESRRKPRTINIIGQITQYAES